MIISVHVYTNLTLAVGGIMTSRYSCTHDIGRATTTSLCTACLLTKTGTYEMNKLNDEVVTSVAKQNFLLKQKTL